MFKVNNQNTRRRHDVVLVLLLLTLNIFYTFFSVSILDFEQVNVSWEVCFLHINPLSVTKLVKHTRIHTYGYS